MAAGVTDTAPISPLPSLDPYVRWPVSARWAAAGLIAFAALAAWGAGVSFPLFGMLLVAAALLAANAWLRQWSQRLGDRLGTPEGRARFARWQVALDSAALWAAVYLSGGLGSPVLFALLVPACCAALLLPAPQAWGAGTGILAALALTGLAELAGWLPHQPLIFRGEDLAPAPDAWGTAAALARFAAFGLPIALLAGAILRRLQRRLAALEREREAQARFHHQLQTLFSILETIGSTHTLEQVLETATAETARVMHVKGISVKLLSEDGRFLRYAAAFGLPEHVIGENRVEVARSPLNRRIIEGEPFVTGRLAERESFQFGEALSEAQIQSVLFLPLKVDGRVIGILGAYCAKPDRFSAEDVAFFRLAAKIVAIALENARAYDAVKTLSNERNWFMMKVAHNLRAPLAGMVSILDVVRGRYLGGLTDDQDEYLRRLDRRARTMLSMINELLTLSRNRDRRQEALGGSTVPADLARRVQRTFQDRAAEKRLAFRVELPAEELPPIRGPLETIEQILENLVSNAVKYTPDEGSVAVRFSKADGTVRIEVGDTGIGIPHQDRPRLFTEFFRAENARAMEVVGTGLGLAIVKENIDKLGGRIVVESEEGAGTLFVVHLPAAAGEEKR
jgi:signal transduction histidine kinase